MNLSSGDTLVKGTKSWTVRNVSDGYVELDSGEFVEIEEIHRDIKHDRTRVFHK